VSRPARPTRADAAGRAYLDLQNLARRQGRSTQALLVMYVLERWMARLAVSTHADRFVLKGGMLLAVWDARRATADADFLTRGLNIDREQILARIVAIADAQPPVEDGVDFLTDTATAATIRDGDRYGGVRVIMQTRVAVAEVKLRLDISTGDPVVPPPQRIAYPTLRAEHPALSVVGYPLVVVLAEKLCTAIDLGDTNSRVRDYADVWTLTGRQDIAAADLRTALEATAAHRGVTLRPLTAAISDYGDARQNGYAVFWRRLGPDADHLPADFRRVVADVTAFADPALTGGLPTTGHWDAASRTWL
jgi:hypothetical protein